MVKRTSLEGDSCPVARAVDAIGDWWSLMIIRDCFAGLRRFSQFQRNLGLAKNILTVRLRTLVERGILATEPASDGGAYREYVLTPKGRGLFPIMVALRQWSEEFDERPAEIATMMVDAVNRRPIQKLAVLSEDGRSLGRDDVIIKNRS